MRSQNPGFGSRVLNILEESNGLAEIVSDNEIIEAEKLLARTEGIFAEPSAAASLAGLIKIVNKGIIDK